MRSNPLRANNSKTRPIKTDAIITTTFIQGLNKKDIVIDRKMLSDIATNDESTFEKIVHTAVK